ncbi:MAG: XTP/dITP diphosphatase [Candidatus Scatosoma sp.]
MILQKLIVATGNSHKLKEIREIFPATEVISAAEAGFTQDVEETGQTFEENALIKARAAAEALNLPALADDSGLCVDALGGAPGIYSARYAGGHGDEKANRKKLLKELSGVKQRSARFCCVIALCFPDGKTVTAAGETCGEILYEEQGGNGFGYDCLFFSDDLQKSFGTAEAEEKNAVSHRGRALRALKEKLSRTQEETI